MILPAILYALACVESGQNPAALGKHGERSAWQLTEAAWKEETGVPFEYATTRPELAEAVVIWRIKRICRGLEQHGVEITPEAIARAWNPLAPPDYAQRVVNLYYDYLQP